MQVFRLIIPDVGIAQFVKMSVLLVLYQVTSGRLIRIGMNSTMHLIVEKQLVSVMEE